MSVYEKDDFELSVLVEEAVGVALRNAREVAVDVTESSVVTPALAFRAVVLLESLSNVERLRRAHKAAVAG